MDNAVLQIRISKKLKKDSMVVAENLGFTASTLIKLFLAHVVQSRKIPFEIEEIPNAKLAKELDQIEKEEKSGDMRNYVKFANMDEAIAYMKEYVKKSNRRRATKKSLSQKTRRRSAVHPKTSVQATPII
jgi:addiction module RelB/DinJ family antitoxin